MPSRDSRAAFGWRAAPGVAKIGEPGIVLDHGGAAEMVVVQIDRDDPLLFKGAANGDRNRIDQRAVDQKPVVAVDRLEHAGQRIGGAHGVDERAARQPDFMAGADFGGHADERLGQIAERVAAKMIGELLRQLQAAEQAVAAEMKIQQAENAALCQAAGELFEFVQLACQITAADQRADGGAGDHADGDLWPRQGRG